MRALVLLAVPGAFAPQPAGDLVEALERLGGRRFGAAALRRLGGHRGASRREARCPDGTVPGGTLPGGTLPGGTRRGTPPGGTAPPGTGLSPGGSAPGSPAGAGRGGPCGRTAGGGGAEDACGAGVGRRLAAERTRHSPVVSISSWVQVGRRGRGVGAAVDPEARRRRTCARSTSSGSRSGTAWRSPAGAGRRASGGPARLTSVSGWVVGRGDLLDLDHVVAGVGLERADELALGRARRSARPAPARTGRRPRPGAGRRSTSSPRRSSTSSPPPRTTSRESSSCSAASAWSASSSVLVRITRTSRVSGCSNWEMLAS